MSKEKRNIEFDQTVEEQDAGFTLRDLINGNVLTRKAVVRQWRFILLVVIMAFAMIVNRNYAESTVIRLNDLQKEVKELRSESISISSELVRISRQSEVLRLVNRYDLELEENLDPPHKLIKEKE